MTMWPVVLGWFLGPGPFSRPCIDICLQSSFPISSTFSQNQTLEGLGYFTGKKMRCEVSSDCLELKTLQAYSVSFRKGQDLGSTQTFCHSWRRKGNTTTFHSFWVDQPPPRTDKQTLYFQIQACKSGKMQNVCQVGDFFLKNHTKKIYVCVYMSVCVCVCMHL